MTPEELVEVILAGVGICIQLAIMYVPAFNAWYDTLPNKGLVALGFDAAFGGIYFAFACVPVLADLFGVALTCDLVGGFTLAKAIFIIALSQQLSYNFLKSNVEAARLRRLASG